MDKVIGSLISKLEETDMMKDTLVIFASDNGGLAATKFSNCDGKPPKNITNDYPERLLRGFKGSQYEGGHRVPFVMRYDGVLPTGEHRADRYASIADVFATLADFADVPIPRKSAQDSRSFASYARSGSDTDGSMRKYVPVWRSGDHHSGRTLSIRHGDYKFIQHTKTKSEALFNLRKDIRETTNLLQNWTEYEKYRPMIQRLKTKLREEGHCPLDNPDKLKEYEELAHVKDRCQWFAASGNETLKNQRCMMHQPLGELYCHSVCGRYRNLFCQEYDDLMKPPRKFLGDRLMGEVVKE